MTVQFTARGNTFISGSETVAFLCILSMFEEVRGGYWVSTCT